MTQEAKLDGTPVEPPSRWEETIRRFEAEDKAGAVPPGQILFAGSSSITKWDLPRYFGPVPASTSQTPAGPHHLPLVNRGFGGSYLSEVAHFARRYVVPPRPRQVVLYAGDNDLGIGRSPQHVLASFRQFLAEVGAGAPPPAILLLAIKPSPLRKRLLDRMRETNRLLEAECRDAAGRDGLTLQFLDVFTPMLDAEGQPRSELYGEDALHMSDEGYLLWTALVRPLLATGR